MGHLPVRSGPDRLRRPRPRARCPPHRRAALGIGYMPEDRGLVPELTVEENILLPVWVNQTLRAEERLELVYRVLPELKEMQRAPRPAAFRRAAEAGGAGPRARRRHPPAAARRAVRGRRAGALEAARRGDRRPEGQRGLGADGAERPESRPPPGRPRGGDRARRERGADRGREAARDESLARAPGAGDAPRGALRRSRRPLLRRPAGRAARDVRAGAGRSAAATRRSSTKAGAGAMPRPAPRPIGSPPASRRAASSPATGC